jgi:glycosyltransferase involved in cell wall biosynthesis
MWFYRHIERLYLQTADAFITNSHTTHHTIQQLLANVIPRSPEESLRTSNPSGIPPQRLVGMTNGKPTLIATPAGNRFNLTITPAAIASRAHHPGPLRLLFIGNLIPRKGLHHLLTAVSQLPPHTTHLHIVGNTAVSPCYTRAIQQQIAQNNLQTAVTLHQTLADKQLAQLMLHSHLLVVPSTYEGFGIVYLEGMAAALPAIATNAGAAHEIIHDGHNGYLINVGDTTALTQHLLHLHQNRDHLTQLSHNALSHFQSHPTWTESMSRIRQFLLELIGRQATEQH